MVDGQTDGRLDEGISECLIALLIPSYCYFPFTWAPPPPPGQQQYYGAVHRWAIAAGPFSPAPNPGSLSWLLGTCLWPSITDSLSFLPLPVTPLPLSFCPCSTASNSNRSTPACSPILRKRSRSPTPQNVDGDTMVEKGSDHSSDKSPSTPEQGVQRSCSSQSGRSGGKNSKVSLTRRPLCPCSVAGCREAGVGGTVR